MTAKLGKFNCRKYKFYFFLAHFSDLQCFIDIWADGISMPEEERTGYEWLQEREKPEKFQVAGKMYSGPKIVEN